MANGTAEDEFDPILSPRKGMPSPQLEEAEFRRRYVSLFEDPAFEPLKAEIDKIAGAAWDAYENSRKSPYNRKAGPGYQDPNYDLSEDWIAAKHAIDRAQIHHDDRSLAPRILLINGSSRSEHTCPGEGSKSYRMLEMARQAIEDKGDIEIDILSLDRLASEFGRHIHPCKACFQHRRRSVTGHAPVILTTVSARSTTG